MANVKEKARKVFSAVTADSKKITIALIVLISVIVDEIWLGNVIYPKGELFTCNVWRAIEVTIGVIFLKDIQDIVRLFKGLPKK